jgi:hypothetical protein
LDRFIPKKPLTIEQHASANANCARCHRHTLTQLQPSKQSPSQPARTHHLGTDLNKQQAIAIVCQLQIDACLKRL